MIECRYCGSDVDCHDPVFVREGIDRADAGAFCNYACLRSHIEEAGLEEGAACEWSPSG